MTLHAHGPDAGAPELNAVAADAPIVVAGAGLSGLVAAHLLNRIGLDVTLIEARERIGGRVFGLATGGGTHRFDHGPAWVWPEGNPRLAHWLSALGLALLEQHGSGAGLVELPSQAVRRHATGFAQQPPSMRIVCGTACLIDTLRAQLVRTRVLLGTRVRGLAASPGGAVGVELERGRAGPDADVVLGDICLAPKAVGVDAVLVTRATH